MRRLLSSRTDTPTDTTPSNPLGVVDLDSRCILSPAVSLRPERFGALAYSFDTRRLSFLKHPDLVRVVESLADHDTVRATLEAEGIDNRRWGSFVAALQTLADSEMIDEL